MTTNRRTFLKDSATAAGSLALANAMAPWAAHSEEKRRPNLLFILTDDHRWDALGSAGNPIVQTPNLDRIAAEGVSFTRNFVVTSICCTSRANIFSGMYGSRNGVEDFSVFFDPDTWSQCYPTLLRKAGYRTGFVGKWGVGHDLPEDEFDFWGGYAGQGKYLEEIDGKMTHMTERLGTKSLEFLEGCDGSQPFCLSISFKAPHCQDGAERQFPPDPDLESLYADTEIPRPETATEEYFSRLPEFLQQSEARKRWEVRFATDEMRQNSVRDYYRLITGVDNQVGNLLAKLEEMGALDNTVIVFTGDNGFYLGEHGLAGKWFMHEESIRTPLLVYDPTLPKEKRGRKVDPMALNIDISPTLLDYAGVEIPDRVQGRSVRSIVEGESPKDWRTEWFYEHHFKHPRIPQTEGVRTEVWKYTRYIDVDPVYEELFDLEKDPHEKNNLVGNPDYDSQLKQLRGKWEKMRDAVA
ncbi:MAG: sulfatase [Candidatus Omnitrophica bacterium]|nr:sulfatase [Candidatus Omnitrophota bacterium]